MVFLVIIPALVFVCGLLAFYNASRNRFKKAYYYLNTVWVIIFGEIIAMGLSIYVQ
jgi:hypothetical protein